MTQNPTININEILSQIENSRKEAEANALNSRQVIAKRALELGIDMITIKFAGYGDSGSIEEVSMTVDGVEDKLQPEEFHKQVEDFGYDYLAGTGIDWYNNEGGQGEIVFDLKHVPMIFSAEVDVNIVRTENEHYVEEFL